MMMYDVANYTFSWICNIQILDICHVCIVVASNTSQKENIVNASVSATVYFDTSQ